MEAVCLLFSMSSDLDAIRVVTLELLLAAGDVANSLVAAVDTVRVSVAGPVLWDAVPLVPALELSRGAPCCVAQLVPFVKTVHLCQEWIDELKSKHMKILPHLAVFARAVDLSVTLPSKGDTQAGAAPELLRLAR